MWGSQAGPGYRVDAEASASRAYIHGPWPTPEVSMEPWPPHVGVTEGVAVSSQGQNGNDDERGVEGGRAVRGAPAADVRDRVPDARERFRRRGRGAGGVPALPPRD